VSSDSKNELENLIERLRKDIIPMFEKIITSDDVLFSNPNIVTCWKLLDCKRNSCHLYGDDSPQMRCWQIAGTYCGGNPQGGFVEKYGKCSNCKVFKSSCPTIVEEMGEHFNNMVYLLRQKGKLLEDKQKVELLNQELYSALEQLDNKNREIQEMMITDKLTGLYNRYHLITVFDDEIARCCRYGRPLALMIADIDKFKSFNDSYGHVAGDNMLSAIGAIIKRDIRKFDRAFRFGGEEFVIILPETDSMLAYTVAERIRKGFQEKSFTVKRGEKKESASRTISIGITHTSSDNGIEQLINHADKALYMAKSNGGNTCVKYEE